MIRSDALSNVILLYNNNPSELMSISSGYQFVVFVAINDCNAGQYYNSKSYKLFFFFNYLYFCFQFNSFSCFSCLENQYILNQQSLCHSCLPEGICLNGILFNKDGCH